MVLLDPSTVISHRDLQAYCLNAHHTYFNSSQCLLLRPGDSLSVPLCTVPLMIAMPYDETNHKMIPPGTPEYKSTEVAMYGSFTVACPFDAARDSTHSVEATATALSHYNESLSQLPANIKSDIQVKLWKSGMEGRVQED